MRVCPSCGTIVDESRSPLGSAVNCHRCGAPVGATLQSKPPVAAASMNPFSDQAGPVNPFTNPYAYPGKWEPNRVLAQSKVQAPGVILQVYGVLLCLAGLACIGFIPLALTQPKVEDQVVMTVFACLGLVLAVPTGGVIFWGGTKMKQLQSYGWALAAVIVTLAIGFLACLPAVFIGIWPLIVILDADVKASFART